MPIMAKSNDEYTEVKAIKTPNGTEIDYVLSKVDNTYKRTYTAIRELEDTPPLEFKSIKPNANLIDYRIYGQTVDGESVGDRTGNLFYKKIENANISSNGGIYSDNYDLWIGKVIAGETYTAYNINSVVGFFTDEPNYGSYTYNSSRIVDATTVYTFTVPSGYSYVAIRFLKNATRAMLNLGDTALPYEPYGYKVPVTVSNGTDTLTTPIYLPEQIRKVGNEAEYIDYGEQRQHRVRKNYLQSSDFEGGAILTGQTWKNFTYQDSKTYPGMVDSGGVAFDTTRKRSTDLITIIGTYTISIADGWEFVIVMFPNDRNSGETFIYNTAPVTISDCTFAIQIKKTDLSDISSADISDYKIMLNKGAAPLPYEPYIENTELDVTLPALPTVTGTNVLSVGTEVQPSDMYIKGNFKMIAGGGE